MPEQRPDSRSESQIRPMATLQGTLSRADGSSKFSFDKTAVMASVFGPMEVKIRDELLDKATVEVVLQPIEGHASTTEKYYEQIIRQTVESVALIALHPRTLIRITCQILNDDGSILSAALNATMLALVDSGIPLKCMVASTTCAVTANGQVLLDPTRSEIETAKSVHIFAFESLSGNLVANESIGPFTEKEYTACHQLCQAASEKIQAFMRASIERKLKKDHRLL
ncbi:ribosomal protein S5 domain 2-type protein [Polychytrium aggregatum]|uniref:ribosomal protein S5 domain 2-type protein n=1 Tax=Polychytrium aggregatum TaxID=110093 RepID=UPI0022FF11B4|nr:ribosomal protein S5 domain 2-type protein [Polychytrium aggregatum]KAI9199386.1 ribosomal protein S5 domain 2-type protein [Polychytrium aggregatum]